jgi:hypothetical protein
VAAAVPSGQLAAGFTCVLGLGWMRPLGPPGLDTARDGGSCARSVGGPQECRAGRGLVESTGGVVTAPHEAGVQTAETRHEDCALPLRATAATSPASATTAAPTELRDSGFDNRWPGATISLATRCTATGTKDCSR